MLKNNVKITVITVVFLLFSFNSISQGKSQSKYVDTIEVGAMMNTYIKINSTKVLSLDMGGDDNLIFEMDNGVIKMKAIKLNFQPTNFLVICRDTLLQYYIKYNKIPEKTIYEYDYNEIKNRNKSPIMIASNAPKEKTNAKTTFSIDPLAVSNNKSISSPKKEKVNTVAIIDKSESTLPPVSKPINEISKAIIAEAPAIVAKEKVVKRRSGKKYKELEPIVTPVVAASTTVSDIKMTVPLIKTVAKPEVKKVATVVTTKANVSNVAKSKAVTAVTKKPIAKTAVAKPVTVNQKPIAEATPKVVQFVQLSEKEKQTISFLNLLKETSNVQSETRLQGIKVKLSKLYQDDLNIYFYIAVHNSSPIDYQIDYVNFEVKSKDAIFSSTGKQSIYPVFESFEKNADVIDGLDNTNLLYSIEKFALRTDEVLVFSIFEKSNSSKGRSTEIKITSADFDKIKKLK